MQTTILRQNQTLGSRVLAVGHTGLLPPPPTLQDDARGVIAPSAQPLGSKRIEADDAGLHVDVEEVYVERLLLDPAPRQRVDSSLISRVWLAGSLEVLAAVEGSADSLHCADVSIVGKDGSSIGLALGRWLLAEVLQNLFTSLDDPAERSRYPSDPDDCVVRKNIAHSPFIAVANRLHIVPHDPNVFLGRHGDLLSGSFLPVGQSLTGEVYG